MSTKTLNSRSSSNNSSQPWIGNPGLKKLCSLLRNEGHKVLSGTSTFTLTAEVLAHLNADCRRHSLTENDFTTSEIVVSDRSFLPLTSRLRAQQEANRSKAEWSGHIQFIKDFMLSTPCLKLIRYSGTLSSPISLHRFGNLTSLNLRKVPMHMVEGLHKLRGTLISITVYRSVDKVKDLLEFCGGDMTPPMAWPQLKFVSFMFNSVSALDDSLRLLPNIEVFDLSHNSLEACDRFLEYLGDARRITLAYNSLTCVPSVSVTARVSLMCLILRGNNLDNMKGLEALTALQVLDLGENCISEHSLLEPLGCLIRLKKLQLDGNPVYYHKLHRPLTVSRLSSLAVSVEFELDKKKLTLSEISKAELKRTPSHLSTLSVGRVRGHLLNSDYGPSPSSGIGSENESAADSVVSFNHKKKSKRKRLRARTTEILDLDNSGEVSSSYDGTPGTSPHTRSLDKYLRIKREEAIKTQNEIEELRKNYGPNWLQAIADKDVFKQKKALVVPKLESSDAETDNTDQENNSRSTKFFVGSKSSHSSDDKQGMSRKNARLSESESDKFRRDGFPTDDDLYLTDTRMSDTNNPIMASIARIAAGYSTDDTDVGNKSSIGFHPQSCETHSEFTVENMFSKPIDSTFENSSNFSTKNSSSSPALGATESTNQIVRNANSQNCLNENLEKLNQNYIHEPISTLSNTYQPSDKISAKENVTSLSKQMVPSVKSESETSSKLSNSDLKSLMPASPDMSDTKTSLCSPSALLEKEEVTESMFATLPLQENKIIIMALTASYLVEKDIRGKVTEKLELASLTDMKWKKIKKARDGTMQETDQGESSENELEGSAVVVAIGDLEGTINVETSDDKTDRIQLDLKFDYVRKDRQSRSYIVDFMDGKIILDHLQLFLDCREGKERAQLMIVMQCLKCNRTFMKSELIQQQNQLPTSGSSKDLRSMKELLSKATLICPKCGSSLIIELEPTSPVGSYTSSTGSSVDQTKKGAKFGKKNAKKAKDSKLNVSTTTTVRDRNNAFMVQPRMSRSAINISKEQQMSEGDEFACVEDHFSAEAMTSIQTFSNLADMTTSLQGDCSSRGSKASVRRKSHRKSHSGVSDEKYEPQSINVKQRTLASCEINESGVINGFDNTTRPISIERRLSLIEGSNCRNDEKLGISSERVSVHKNLAAMEDIVNSLVTEGKCLEEQESFGISSYSSIKGKSVSISTFKRASVSHIRKTSVCSDEGLKHSESSSSIAVIPILPSATNIDTFTCMPTLSSSVPVAFSERITVERGISENNAEKVGNALVSPLSSSICSSMVSSVYETSVNNPERNIESNYQGFGNGSSIGLSGVDNADDIESTTCGTIMVIGSSSSSSEDLTSIYDHPREPKSSSRKKKHSKLRSIPTPSVPFSDDVHASNSVLQLSADSQASSETTSQTLPVLNSADSMITAPSSTVEGSDDVNDTDEENDEELVPQYAFHHLNHRLTLYMMMSLFGADEEFLCKLQGEIVQYIIQKPYEGILVMSSSRFYVLKITSEDHSQTPDQWLHCVEIQPIPELRYIDVGLGGQSLRLEFVTDCSSYTFITRNRDKTTQFVDMLHTNLAKYALSQGIASHVIVNEDADPITLNNLDREVVSKITPDQKMLHYCTGFIERGNQKLFPISFITTTCDVCLVVTNHQWPQPRLQAPITEETMGKQFTVLERQKVSNVASVEVCEATMKKIRLELFNETEGVSTSWNITLAARQSTVDFINAISEPWAKAFGVEMDVVYAELSF